MIVPQPWAKLKSQPVATLPTDARNESDTPSCYADGDDPGHCRRQPTQRSQAKLMMQSDESRITATYTAYLVRLWQEQAEIPWRASAQSARTGEKIYFSDLESLFVFLRSQTNTELGIGR
jgi:hypothetical protein